MADRGFALRIIQRINAGDADNRNRFLRWLFAVIPDKIENRTVIRFLEMLRRFQRQKKMDFSSNLKWNQQNFPAHLDEIKRKKGYIEDQNRYTDLHFGKVTMQFSGCEIFAVYNALNDLRKSPEPALPELIAAFEKDGMILDGGLGTSPPALRDYLEKCGFRTVFTTKEEEFDSLAARSDGLILTIYNDRSDVSMAVHTIYISKQNNRYTAHNTYCSGKVLGPYRSVKELLFHINDGKAKGICMIGLTAGCRPDRSEK